MTPGILARRVDIEFVMGMLDHGHAQALRQKMRKRTRQQGGLAGAAPAGEANYFHLGLRDPTARLPSLRGATAPKQSRSCSGSGLLRFARNDGTHSCSCLGKLYIGARS